MRTTHIMLLLALVAHAGCDRAGESAPAPTIESAVTDTMASPYGDPPRGFDYATRVGVIEATTSGLCLTIRNDSLAPGAPLLIVSADSADLQAMPGIVTGPITEPCSKPGTGEGGFLDDGDAQHYAVRPQGDLGTDTRLFMAVLGPVPRPQLRNFSWRADLDGDSIGERFELCASFEGLHFSIIT